MKDSKTAFGVDCLNLLLILAWTHGLARALCQIFSLHLAVCEVVCVCVCVCVLASHGAVC